MSQSTLARPRIHKINNDTDFYFNFKVLIQTEKIICFYVSIEHFKKLIKKLDHTHTILPKELKNQVLCHRKLKLKINDKDLIF